MDSLADWAYVRLAVEVITDVAGKATIILGLAWLATTLLRRASAATRHGIWSLALAGLFLLPLLSVGLPSWLVPVPEGVQPLWTHHRAGEGTEVAAPTPSDPVDAAGEMTPSPLPAPVMNPGESRLTPTGEALATEHLVTPETPMATGRPWAFWTLLVWGVGAAALLGHLLIHVLRIGLLTRQAAVVDDPQRVDDVMRLARRLGIRRRIRILSNPGVSMAMTWGLWRPVVMLPVEATSWCDERVRVVLLHELAHIRRWDYLIHLLTQVVRACYWFNPLVWVAARRIHVEQERACDDQVLQAGAGACDYAAHLIDIARTFLKRRAALPGGIAMVHGSTLKERVVAILNVHSNRHAVSLKSGLVTACLGTCMILPIAIMQPCAPGIRAAWSPAAGLHNDDPALWHQAALSPDLESTTLATLLGHEDAVIRSRAAWALGERKATPAVEPLLAALADEAARVRLQAVLALGKIGDKQALDRLGEMLDDTCSDVRAASVRAVGQLCRCHALSILPAALRDPNDHVRMTAASVLGETIRALRDDDSIRAKRALRDHLDPAVDALLAAVDDESPAVRQHIAYALGETRDEAAVDPLKTALRDAAAPVRLEALQALGKIGASCAAPAVRAALSDRDPAVRAMAATVLNQL